MPRSGRNTLSKVGAALAALGLALFVAGVATGRECNFDLALRCRAFGIWEGDAFLLGGVAGLSVLVGVATGGLGLILFLVRLMRPKPKI